MEIPSMFTVAQLMVAIAYRVDALRKINSAHALLHFFYQMLEPEGKENFYHEFIGKRVPASIEESRLAFFEYCRALSAAIRNQP